MRNLVLQFVPSLSDGGAETLVKDYCIIGKANHIRMKIVMYMDFPNTANSRIVKENEIPIIKLYKMWNLPTRIFHKLFGRKYIAHKLKKVIVEEKPVAIHVHMKLLDYLAELSGFLKSTNIKLFYTCHSDPERYFSDRDSKEYIACKKLIENNNLQLIALHEEMKNKLNSMFSISNTIVVRNGVNFNVFHQISISKSEKRRELEIGEEAFVIGHIGRFMSLKNHAFLIDIFSEVLKIKPSAHLLLVGSGELKTKIQEKATKLGIISKITFLSNRTDISEILSIMDVFVFPSLVEGLSITLVEAQVVGIPCVVSDRINRETYCSNKICELSIDDPISKWVNAITEFKPNIKTWENINNYDLNKEILKLIQLYT